MIRPAIQRSVTFLIIVCLATFPVVQSAQAAIITTDTAIEISDHGIQVDRVNQLLAQQSVQTVMVKLGVDPSDASARVQSLTAEELQMLEENLADLPAGGVGVVEVVGIVAIVLIILELLDITDIFKSF